MILKHRNKNGTQIIGISRFRATSMALITFGTIASPPFTAAGLYGKIKSFYKDVNLEREIKELSLYY